VSQAAEAIVRDFIDSWMNPLPDVIAAYEKYMTDEAVWENVGFPATRGKAAILSKLRMTKEVFGDYHVGVEILNMASNDDVVFTQRIDTGFDSDGNALLSEPCAGVFTVVDGRITHWIDYFDPRGLVEHLEAKGDVGAYFTQG
jgi:limonene-1,2-epoxide hydrolase